MTDNGFPKRPIIRDMNGTQYTALGNCPGNRGEGHTFSYAGQIVKEVQEPDPTGLHTALVTEMVVYHSFYCAHCLLHAFLEIQRMTQQDPARNMGPDGDGKVM